MIFRAKTIHGKKLSVEEIHGMEIWTAACLPSEYAPPRDMPYRLDKIIDRKPKRDSQFEDHTEFDIQRYKLEDLLRKDETYFLVARCENQEKLSILKRTDQKKCEKYKRKIERRQARKSWFDTYHSIIKIVGSTIAAIITLMIVIIKNC